MLYAIIATPGKPELLTRCLSEVKGIDQSELVALSHEGLTAVLGETSRVNVVANTENALAYARVIDELFCRDAVLPVRYGTLMDSNGSVIAMLEKYGKAFVQNLQRVANKEEFSLKVLWNYEKGSEKIRQQMEVTEIKAGAPFHENSATKEYLMRKVKEHRFENALLAHVEQLIGEICHLVEQFNPAHHFNKMVSRTMILDAVFLLEKGKKEELVQSINQLKNRHEDLQFLLTGPWPPYNFVELNVK